MKYKQTTGKKLVSPEVVLNLWAYASEDGYIMRLAGKAYVLQGDDEDKLTQLRMLSGTDFLSAPWVKVPSTFKLVNADGNEMIGVAGMSALSNPTEHGHLFGPLMEEIARSIPEQLCSFEGEYRKLRLELPQNPLMVTTVVIEHEDGSLIPMTSE